MVIEVFPILFWLRKNGRTTRLLVDDRFKMVKK